MKALHRKPGSPAAKAAEEELDALEQRVTNANLCEDNSKAILNLDLLKEFRHLDPGDSSFSDEEAEEYFKNFMFEEEPLGDEDTAALKFLCPKKDASS